MPSRRLFKYFLLCAPLTLAACGEGYEMTRIEGIVPYTLERTAGTGVAYVRAKMLPEKAIVIESKTEAPVAPAPAPKEELKSAEPVFKEQQKK
jgi:hypothetical protein